MKNTSKPRPLAIVTPLGYLYCNDCAAVRGWLDGPQNVWSLWSDNAAHHDEKCDACERAVFVALNAERTALPGQGELPANLERDLRDLIRDCSICRRRHGREIVHACE